MVLILICDQAVTSGKYQQSRLNRNRESIMEIVDYKAERREERRKKATGGKGGGGTQVSSEHYYCSVCIEINEYTYTITENQTNRNKKLWLNYWGNAFK